MKKLSNKQKRILCFIGLGVIFILMGNSNNSPEIFIQKILKPIRGDNWTFNYSGFIVIGGIYYCLYKLNEIGKNRLIMTPIRRFIIIMVLMNIFPSIRNDCVQIYKGFYKDLNSIYLYREDSYMNFNKNDGMITIDGRIDVKNCNNETQEFYIKIRTPSLVKSDINEEYVTLPKKYKLGPKEKRPIIISQELLGTGEGLYSGYIMANGSEYVLFNDKDEVIFKGTIEECRYDDRALYY